MNKKKMPEDGLVDLSLEEEVEIMAGCNWAPSDMATYLGFEKKAFLSQYNTPGTRIWEAARRGKLKTDMTISFRQKTLAEAGNITAVQIFEKMKEQKETEALRNKVWFNE